MKIGIDCRLWNETGIGRYTRNLVRQLHLMDDKNSYVLFVNSTDLVDINREITNKLWKIKSVNIKWHTIKEQLLFPASLSDESLDIVHFPYFSVPIFYNRPYIVTIHDLILHHYPTGEASTLPSFLYKAKQIGYKLVVQVAVDNAKKIITVSNATKDEIIEHLGVSKDHVVVTHEGVDRHFNHNIKNIKLNDTKAKINSNSKYILYVGNAYPHKNIQTLIEAFLDIKKNPKNYGLSHIKEVSNVQLILVGKEDFFYRKLSLNYAPEILQNEIVLFGFASDEELTLLYQNAVATVIPSFMEGFGLPALEAMSQKCLVLASDTPSLKEVCGDAAIYFDPKNKESVAKVIGNTLLQNRTYYINYHKLGLENVKKYSWRKMAEETLKIYKSVI